MSDGSVIGLFIERVERDLRRYVDESIAVLGIAIMEARITALENPVEAPADVIEAIEEIEEAEEDLDEAVNDAIDTIIESDELTDLDKANLIDDVIGDTIVPERIHTLHRRII